MTFKDFSIHPSLHKALADLSFEKPTEIQAKALPILLGAPKVDFHGQAQTGTGKTLAFGLPLLSKIDVSLSTTQALVVAPTRELVVQIAQSLKSVAQHLSVNIVPIYGGASMQEQLRALRQGAHIVIGTPGRLNDHLRRKTLSLKSLNILVFDEADIMLDMGFKDEVDEILGFSPHDRQIWLFSATVKPGIEHIKKTYMKNPHVVSVSAQNIGSSTTKQYYCIVPMRQRTQALARFIDSVDEFYGFIFCQTKILAIEVTEHLNSLGYKVGALHGDMSQSQRNRTIKQFKNKEFTILIATDIAARGLDVSDITHVINYSLPNDQESYVHRIGRTGRAGKQGIAISFITKTDQYRIASLQKRFKVIISALQVPSMQELMNIQLKKISGFLADHYQAHSNDTSLTALHEMLQQYSQEQLMTISAGLLKEKFLKQINPDNAPQDQFKEAELSHSSQPTEHDMKEVCLNVGSQDGLIKGHVFDYLKKRSNINQKSVLKIRIIDRKTFLIIDTPRIDQLCKELSGHTLVGRTVRAQLAS